MQWFLIFTFIALGSACTAQKKSDPMPLPKPTELSKKQWITYWADLEKSQNWRELEKAATARLSDFPSDELAFAALGESLSLQGKRKEAEGYYLKAYQEAPKNEFILSNIGEYYQSVNRYSEAENFYDKAISIDQSNPDIWYRKAILSEITGVSSKSESYYSKVVSISPDSILGWRSKTRMLILRKDYGGALNAAASGLQKSPDDDFLYYNASISLMNLNKMTDALKAINKTIDLMPSVAEYHYTRGEIYLSIGPISKAIEDFKYSNSIYPDDVRYLYKLGTAYSLAGDKTKLNTVYADLRRINTQLANKFYNEFIVQ